MISNQPLPSFLPQSKKVANAKNPNASNSIANAFLLDTNVDPNAHVMAAIILTYFCQKFIRQKKLPIKEILGILRTSNNPVTLKNATAKKHIAVKNIVNATMLE